MDVKTFLRDVYSQLPLKNTTDDNFYMFLKHNLKEYSNSLLQIDKEEISRILSDDQFTFFKSSYTLPRLVNLIGRINEDLLKILSLRYKGDVLNSSKLLYKMLFQQRYNNYLVEEFSNYFKFEKNKGFFYRMRDAQAFMADKKENIISDCWHVPYNRRAYAYSGRYSMPSFPALYLGNRKETCDEELGELREGYRRWVSEFTCTTSLFLFDLRIHSAEEIDDSSVYDRLCYLITFPIVAACTAERKSMDSDEEYFFSQLLFHLLSISSKKNASYNGIVYSSTKIKGGENIVIPATYTGDEPPKYGCSEVLKDIFEVSKPKLYKR